MQIMVLVISLLILSGNTGQPGKDKKVLPVAPADTKTDAGDDAPRAAGTVFVIVCDAKPGQMLVLDSAGKWVPNVRDIEIKFEVGKEATITCTIYEGALKPSRPATKTWIVAQMKTVPAVDFQKMVDSLQTDPDAVKNLLKD